MTEFVHDIEVSPAEIREAWSTIQAGRNPFSSRQDASGTVGRFGDYRSREVNTFIGASGPQIQDRLEHGYHVDAKDIDVPGGTTDFVLPRMEFDDEAGDLVIAEVLAGEDLYRVQWQEVDAPSSLTIRACIGMHALTDASVIGAYNEWLLKVIDAAQRRGVTPDVELWIGVRAGLQRESNQSTMRVRIPLVSAGEMVDVSAWRAYLTPGAFRSLGFVALALAADKVKRPLKRTLGYPTNKRWRVTLADGVLDIECPGGANEFPEDHLDQLLAEAGA